ncbi:hypothetical protein [Paracoccus sp. S-4012]|uniref:hypothetical protein n=1 Tax=Paracoccus sp. S-4012 TaxID=2665648 RepID=UPI001E5B6D4A|nr:hypothetical protein [Paracoccus sp. S-4012]
MIEFSKAVDAGIATSMPICAGTRDAQGIWTPDQTRKWFEFTRAVGGEIAAAEYFNEPTVAGMGGAPEGYDGEAYGRDFDIFRKFAEEFAPDMLIHGPGSVGETTEGALIDYGNAGFITTPDLLSGMGYGVKALDAFSFHHYAAVSIRCEGVGPQTTVDAALSEEWLSGVGSTMDFYRQQRDLSVPDAPLWNTETGETACGGNPWAKTFLDTFRYLDQLGRSAKGGVTVHFHNTLAASDYALISDQDFSPRPSYWAALLWRNLMGTTVLDAQVPLQAGQHVYAHCLRGTPGGVAVLAINNDPSVPRTLNLPVDGERYTLSAAELQAEEVQLNGRTLALGEGDAVPELTGEAVAAGEITLEPATITFLALPNAGNSACQ